MRTTRKVGSRQWAVGSEQGSSLPTTHYPLPTALRRGAAAAELALVLPFLSLVFVATLDFCRIFHTAQAIENSARTGALYASGFASNPATASPEEAAKQAAVTECATLDPPLKRENVMTTWEGSFAVVTVRYDFPLLTPFLDPSGVVKISRTVKMGQAPKGP